MGDADREEFWLNAAKKLSRRVNFAWWLQLLSPAFFLTSLLAACLVLLGRRQGGIDHWLPILMGAFFLVVLFTWLKARQKFTPLDESLVRLEAEMGLRNALTAAHQGVGSWPQPVEQTRDGLRWNWSKLTLPLCAGIAFLFTGFLLPIGGANLDENNSQQPKAWQELQADITQLDEEEVVEEDYLEELQKKLDDLTAQDQDDWFSHASLEATDSLKSSHKNEVSRLERDLMKAVQALDGLQANQPSQEAKDRLMADLQETLNGLQSGAMKPNTALLNQLKELGAQQLKKLSPEQLKQLREKMKANAQKLAQSRSGSGKDGDWLDKLMAENNKGPG